MNWLNNIKISTRLTVAFIILILLCVTVEITSYFDMKMLSAGVV